MTRNHQPDQADFRVILPEDIDWKPFPAFPPGARLAVLVATVTITSTLSRRTRPRFLRSAHWAPLPSDGIIFGVGPRWEPTP